MRLGAQTVLVGGDVMHAANVKRIAAEALAACGRIDVLINNAGGMIGRTKIEDYTEAYLYAGAGPERARRSRCSCTRSSRVMRRQSTAT